MNVFSIVLRSSGGGAADDESTLTFSISLRLMLGRR